MKYMIGLTERFGNLYEDTLAYNNYTGQQKNSFFLLS